MKYLVLVFLISILSYSCQEVIDVSFTDADAEIVVEAKITDSTFSWVKLSKSVAVQDSIFPKISNAFIVMTNDAGIKDTLIESPIGVYKGTKMKGVAGMGYKLEIWAEGKYMFSYSYLHPVVLLDSLIINRVPNTSIGFPGSGSNSNSIRYETILQFRDPPGQSNFYRFVEIRNQNRSSRIAISDDKFYDGQYNTLRLRSNTGQYSPGDTITYEIQSIDFPVYNYFDSFVGSSFSVLSSAAPANPISNITGARLGFFSAYSYHRKTLILPI
jgi:hypothetical protein